jgi:hypothetical protein
MRLVNLPFGVCLNRPAADQPEALDGEKDSDALEDDDDDMAC